uniref:Uncharacterized protein n=1 Tax=Anguilla anguilla TaxID=7936 RepID=A0A0E9U0L7_ANGAN
MANKCKKRVI